METENERRLQSFVTMILVHLAYKELAMFTKLSKKSKKEDFERMRGFQDAVEIVQAEYKRIFDAS